MCSRILNVHGELINNIGFTMFFAVGLETADAAKAPEAKLKGTYFRSRTCVRTNGDFDSAGNMKKSK